MIAVANAIHMSGLLVLLGGVAFHVLFGRPLTVCNSASLDSIRRRTSLLVFAGFILLITSGLSKLAMALPIAENVLSLMIIEWLLAALIVVISFLWKRHDYRLVTLLLLIAGFGLIIAANAKPSAAAHSDFLVLASSTVHWIAAAIWIGSSAYLVILPWDTIYHSGNKRSVIAALATRYASILSVALAVVMVSGGLLAFVYVHNVDALNATVYGQSLKLKSFFIVLLSISLSITLLRVAPACKVEGQESDTGPASQSTDGHFRRAVTGDAVLIAAVIGITSIMASQNAPEHAPFLNPQSWQLSAGDIPLTLTLQPVSGSASRARFEVSANSDDQFPDGTRADFALSPPLSGSPEYDQSALPIGPSTFLGEAILATPGKWRLDLRLTYPNGETAAGSRVFTLPAPPLKNDLNSYLSLTTATYSANRITFLVGILLLLSAIGLLLLCVRRRSPLWLVPISIGNAAFGGFLVLSVSFVKTYPSTFWENPEPFNANTVRQGEELYRDHCAECHGITGRGDGPWAKAERGSIPDLTKPHMDVHTDGEIYWWISFGIPSLGMPALADQLSERDRWTVINTVRSFRHRVPPESAENNAK